MQEGGDTERGGNGPHEQAGVDPERRLNRRPASARKAVLENECHVRPRQDDDDSDDADECDYISHVAEASGERALEAARLQTLPATPHPRVRNGGEWLVDDVAEVDAHHARRMVGRPTSANPAAAKMPRLPTWSSLSKVTFSLGWVSMG